MVAGDIRPTSWSTNSRRPCAGCHTCRISNPGPPTLHPPIPCRSHILFVRAMHRLWVAGAAPARFRPSPSPHHLLSGNSSTGSGNEIALLKHARFCKIITCVPNTKACAIVERIPSLGEIERLHSTNTCVSIFGWKVQITETQLLHLRRLWALARTRVELDAFQELQERNCRVVMAGAVLARGRHIEQLFRHRRQAVLGPALIDRAVDPPPGALRAIEFQGTGLVCVHRLRARHAPVLRARARRPAGLHQPAPWSAAPANHNIHTNPLQIPSQPSATPTPFQYSHPPQHQFQHLQQF